MKGNKLAQTIKKIWFEIIKDKKGDRGQKEETFWK